MQSIQLSAVIIPEDRQRKEFPAAEMETLKTSIVSKGLMHPPVLRDDGKTLVAGERRLRALTELHKEGRAFSCRGEVVPAGLLPVTLLGELTDFEVREAELEENVVRLSLTWQERACAYASLHKLRQEQAAQPSNGAKTPQPHSFTDTAKEIYGFAAQGEQVLSVHEAVILTDNLHLPDVAAAKSQKEAVKVLKKIKEGEHRAKLAAVFDLTRTPHSLHHGSAFDLLKTFPSATYDCILTDPPYGVGAGEFGDMASTGHNYVDSVENALACYALVAEEGFRVAKAEAHAYVFSDFSLFAKIADLFALAGWDVWKRPLIWSKGNGMLPRPEQGPRNTYECILFASKGKRKTLCVKADVINVGSDRRLLHGAQKPVALYSDLLSRTCRPGDTVLDCFGGSGPVIPAATASQVVATYVELSEHNYNIAISRLHEASPDDLNLPV